MCSFPAWLADAPWLRARATFLVFLTARVLNAVHTLAASAVSAEFVITRETRPPPRTSSRSLVVTRQRIPPCESPTTLVAGVRPFARVQLRVTLQVVQTPEARLTRLAHIWLFLAVRQQVALEIVMASEIG